MYDNGDILLFALSAERQVSWAGFKRCFDEVHRRAVTAGQHQNSENATGHRW